MIIGISGWAKSGKSTVADILVEKHGFTKVAYADKLREALYVLDPIVDAKGTTLREVIDHFGWEGYKETDYYDEIRGLMQRLGTEVGRKMLGSDTWVDATFAKIRQGDKVVITDVRYVNELLPIEQDVSGVIWRVNREGNYPANEHSSENALNDWPFEITVENNGTIEELEGAVELALAASNF